MLFRHQHRPQYQQAKVIIVPNHTNSCNKVPDRLDLLCKQPGHPLPCRMRFIGSGVSPKGQSYATWACPLCNAREGWVFDRYTGKPFRLWSKPGGNGR